MCLCSIILYVRCFAVIPMLQPRRKRLRKTTSTLWAKCEGSKAGGIRRRYEAMATYLPATSRLTKCPFYIRAGVKKLLEMSERQKNSWPSKSKNQSRAGLIKINNNRPPPQNGCKPQSRKVNYPRYQIQALHQDLRASHHPKQTIGNHLSDITRTLVIWNKVISPYYRGKLRN